MSLPKDFWDKLPRRSDEELRDMLAHPGSYQPEAIAAAQAEWDRRALPPEWIAELESINRAKQILAHNIATEPLPRSSRLSAAISLLSLGPFIDAVCYYQQGYKRKARELVVSAVTGLIIFFILILLMRFYFSADS